MNISGFLCGTLSHRMINGSSFGSLKVITFSTDQRVAPPACYFCETACQSPLSNSTPVFGPGTWRPAWGSYLWARRPTSSTRWVTKKKPFLFLRAHNWKSSSTLCCCCCFPGQQEKGNTPLHIAAKAGQVFQAELLAVYGADPGALDSSGKTPIDYARWRWTCNFSFFLFLYHSTWFSFERKKKS